MPDDPSSGSESLPKFEFVPGPRYLRHYPAYDLVAWQPHGVLNDRLLDDIGEWLAHVEQRASPFRRFIDFTQLTNVHISIHHVFSFARTRTEQFSGAPVKSALFSDDWVGFGIAHLYETLMKNTPVMARAFFSRAEAATWLGVPEEVLQLKNKPPARA